MLRRFHLHPPRHTSLPLTLNFIRHVQSTKFTSSTPPPPPPPPPSVSSSTSNCDQHDFVSSAKNFGNDKFVSQNTTNNDQEQILVNHQNQQMRFQYQQEENTRNNNNATSADATRKLADTMSTILSHYFNTLPIKEMQGKIKKEKKIDLEEFLAQWFLQNENPDCSNFVDEANSLCAIPRSTKVYRDLFNNLSAAASEALRLGSLPHLLRRHGKILIDPAFGAIFTTNVNKSKCSDRHFAEFPIQLGFWKDADLFNSFFEKWRCGGSEVLILYGSSGVGKTCAALDFARTAFNDENNSSTFVAYINLNQGVKYYGINDKNKTQRNKDVQEVMMKSLVEAIVGDLDDGANDKTDADALSSRIVPWADAAAKKSHFVAVIDECGLSESFLRGLVDTTYDLGTQLHNIFFADKVETGKNPPRVHFIAAGTGANYSIVPPASDASQHSCFNLDSTVSKVDPLFHLLNHNQNGFPTKSNLLRLSKAFIRQRRQDGTEEEQLSAEEEQAAALCTNFRAAACVLCEFSSFSKAVALLKIADQHELHKFRKALGHILPRAVSRYCSMNGLAQFAFPIQVIACAVAVDLHRLPFLPAASYAHIADVETFRYTNVYAALCGLCGSLVGQAPRRIRSETNTFFDLESQELRGDPTNLRHAKTVSIQNIVPQRGKPSADPQEGVLVLDAKAEVFNRFQCSPAIRAMFRIALGIVPSSSSHWSGAEQRFADLCVLLAPLSNIVETLYAGINNEFKAANTCYFNPKTKSVESPLTMKKYLELLDDLPHFHDPLRRIKQLLVFQGKGVSASAKFQLYSSPVGYIDADDSEISSQENVFESAKEKALEIYNLVSNKVRNGTVAVLVSPPMDQFADGIVVGPGKVILFQCKSLIGIDHQDNAAAFKISWHDELAKMGVLLGRDPRKHKADKLRELWLLTLIAAASVGTSKREFEKQLDVLTQSCDFNNIEASSMYRGTKKTDVSLHVVFFADCGRQLARELMTEFKKNISFEKNNKNSNNRCQQNKSNNSYAGVKNNNNNNNNNMRSTRNYVLGQNNDRANFRNDVRLCSVDLVAMQRKVVPKNKDEAINDSNNNNTNFDLLDNEYFATSFDSAPVPSSTLLSPEASCRLLKNGINTDGGNDDNNCNNNDDDDDDDDNNYNNTNKLDEKDKF